MHTTIKKILCTVLTLGFFLPAAHGAQVEKDFYFSDENGKTIGALFSGATVCAKVYLSDDSLVFLAAAQYNGQNALNAVTASTGRKSLQTSALTISDATNTYMRAFLWNPETLEPLSKPLYQDQYSKAGLYVSATGDDSNNGSYDAPFQTLQKAQQVARLAVNRGEDITIFIEGGDYYNANLSFNEADSPKNGCTVTYRGYNGIPRLYGGHKVTGWQKYNETIYCANIGTDATNITENGEHATLARYPNDSYLVAKPYPEASTGSKNAYMFDSLPQINDFSKLQTFVFAGDNTSWFSSTVPVKSINYADKTVTLGGNAKSNIGNGSRYFLQGAIELLDTPGEFFCKDGILYYYPKSSSIEDQTIVASNEAPLFSFVGEQEKVQGIALENLELNLSGRDKDTVYLSNASHITINSCIITNSGNHGVYMDGYADNNRVENCEIKYAGHSGVQLAGSYVGSQVSPDNVTRIYKNHHNVITNNHIYSGGQFVGHGAGLQMIDSGNNTVTHNLIHDFPRYGISFKGGRPHSIIGRTVEGVLITEENYRDFIHAHDNLVQYNEIYDVNNDTQDTGMIESWGAGENNIISKNYLHDSGVPFSFGFGIYLDDGSNGFTVEKNLIVNLQEDNTSGKLTTPLMIKGIRNKVIGNVVVDNPNAEAMMSTHAMAGEPNNSIESRHNIFYRSGDYVYKNVSPQDDRFTYSDENVFYKENGIYRVSDKQGISFLEDWQREKGFDQRSVTVDPQFMGEGDYRLKYSSPAYRLGITDIDYYNMGLTDSFPFAWQEEVENIWLESGFISIKSGQKQTIKVYGNTATGFRVIPEGVAFTSSNPSVATVDETGCVTGISKGKTEIVVTYQTIEKRMDVLVDDTLSSVVLETPLNTMRLSSSMRCTVYGLTEHGQVLPADVTLTSSNPLNISVNDKTQLTANVVGNAEISATLTYQGKTVTTSKTIDVRSEILQKVDFTADRLSILVGDSVSTSLACYLSNGTALTSGLSISYESMNPEVAAIQPDGTITGTSAGKAQVKVVVSYQNNILEKLLNIVVLSDYRNPYESVGLDAIDAYYGVEIDRQGDMIKSCDPGDWMLYGSFDFGSGGISGLMASMAVRTSNQGGKFWFHIDDRSKNNRFAYIEVTPSGAGTWNDFSELTGVITNPNITGKHDIYVTFESSQAGVGNMKWFRFLK